MAEAFQYAEVWTKLEADGGARQAFFLPINPKRRFRLNGEDSYSFAILKTHRAAALIAKGKVIREVLSLDGTAVREWKVDRYAKGSGSDLIVQVECVGIIADLVNYPVNTTDADGFVYSDTGAIQLPQATVISDYLLGNTPSYYAVGTVTPTTVTEVPFSGDSALSGARRLEEAVRGYEISLRRNGGSQYLVDFTVLGGSAPILYARTGKNIKSFRREVIPGQVTRVNQITGAVGDDGASNIAWAYWEVVSTSGSGPYRVKLKAIHGGPGPILYDGQLSHSGLPGGANSLYLEKRNGTYIQITGSWAGSTQEVEVSSLTTISAGDWVRIVASSTGQHLISLDSPAGISTYGVLAGKYESAWDDTLCILKNALMETWPSTIPTGWTSAGAVASKTTADGEWLTSGAALKINGTVSHGLTIAMPPARTWFIKPRRTNYTAVAWIRLLSAIPSGDITFHVLVGSTPIPGTAITYTGPVGPWRQLKIEGIDLSAYVNTSISLSAEILKSNGSSSGVQVIVDSICLGPSVGARAVTTGSNAARTWQGINNALEDHAEDQVSYTLGLADLSRMGVPAQQDLVLGGTVVVVDDELGTVTNRIVEISDSPWHPEETEVVVSTLPARMSREQSKPAALVIPFFESLEVRTAARDVRGAALVCKAIISSQTASTVTISLIVLDSLGGSPAVTYNVYGGTTYVSGSGSGPYIVSKPAAGVGVGRAEFTASMPGRTSATDAVDVPEAAGLPNPDLKVTPGTQTTTTQVYTVTAVDPTGGGASIALTVLLSGTTGSASSSGSISDGVAKTISTGEVITVNRQVFTTNPVTATFRAVLSGVTTADRSETILNRDPVTPKLDLVGVPSSTNYVISGTTVGTIEKNVDSAGWTSFNPGTSLPLTISLDASPHDVAFRATSDGIVDNKSFAIPSLPATALPSIAISISDADIDDDSWQIAYTPTNAPVGAVYNLFSSVGNHSAIGSPFTLPAGEDLTGKDPGWDTYNAEVSVEMRTSGGTLLATDTATAFGYYIP